ncbi:hypothetical protein TL16_g09844 [Triparma laevis f. inornata]|uniref:Phospholipid/glycerol acyltransferase domain-containing protein n=1 Tax=Triparma laevis f. inornata TaxID=1714386 RepID=A0A9W7BAK7_9STRA|nr:hypothetical protein TL16_g09844 [Triparma laevis f. inornata]
MSKPSHVIGTYTSAQKGVFGREPLTTFGTVKMYLGFAIIVPIRLALLIPFHLIMCMLIMLCLLGAEPGGAVGCRRTVFEYLAYIWQRGNLFLFGFYWIPSKGKQTMPENESCVVIGNHCSWMEVGFMFAKYCPSFVGKSSLKSIPVIGSIAVANKTIFIDRLAKNRGGVTGQIVEHLQKTQGSKVGIFPEGTTSNGTSIVSFRSGAFVAGVPVVPCVFKYPYRFYDQSFSSVSLKFHIFGTMAQLINFMEVEYLPVYYPSEEEKADPKLYAGNVKKAMIEASGLIDSAATYEDKLKWEDEVGYENKEMVRKRAMEKKKKEEGGEESEMVENQV